MTEKTSQSERPKQSDQPDPNASERAEAPGDAQRADGAAKPDSPPLPGKQGKPEASQPEGSTQNAAPTESSLAVAAPPSTDPQIEQTAQSSKAAPTKEPLLESSGQAALDASRAQDLPRNTAAVDASVADVPPTPIQEQSPADAMKVEEPVHDSPAKALPLEDPDATAVRKSEQAGQRILSDTLESDLQVDPPEQRAKETATDQAAQAAPAVQPIVKPLGAFKLWTVDNNGVFVNAKAEVNGVKVKPKPDPAAPGAVDIYMSPTGRASDDQAKLYDDVNAVLDVVRRLYLPDGTRPNATKFRTYYVRVFRLAQVGLEGTDPSPKQSKGALESLKGSLLDDEGLNIKTKNLSALGWTAWKFSWPLLVVYAFLRLVGPGNVDTFLNTLQISRVAAANVTLLWIGCFVGVCLSYGVRTSTLTLTDLVTPGPDRLSPSLRLLFIGTLTMFFGLLFMMKIVELKIGEYSTASIGNDPSVAFIVGILFGLSESALPGLAGKRAEGFLKGLQ